MYQLEGNYWRDFWGHRELLVFLMRHPGRAFRREELLQSVWGYSFGDSSTVTVHVRRLRMKLGGETAYIETVTGAGYKFATPAARP